MPVRYAECIQHYQHSSASANYFIKFSWQEFTLYEKWMYLMHFQIVNWHVPYVSLKDCKGQRYSVDPEIEKLSELFTRLSFWVKHITTGYFRAWAHDWFVRWRHRVGLCGLEKGNSSFSNTGQSVNPQHTDIFYKILCKYFQVPFPLAKFHSETLWGLWLLFQGKSNNKIHRGMLMH